MSLKADALLELLIDKGIVTREEFNAVFKPRYHNRFSGRDTCKCGHTRVDHLDGKSCFWEYNCGCEKFTEEDKDA